MSTSSKADESLFTKDELSTLKKEFNNFDTDNSGNLDTKEVIAIIQKSTGQKPSETEVKHVMNIVDKNKNDAIEFDEFLTMVRYVRIIDNTAYEQFQFFDKNNDGQIEYAELKKSLKELNNNLAKAEIKLMMKEADADKDGKISFAEFRDMICDGSSDEW